MVIITPAAITNQTLSSHILHVLRIFLFKHVLGHVLKDKRKPHVLFRRSPRIWIDVNGHRIWNGRDVNILIERVFAHVVCDNAQKANASGDLECCGNIIMRRSV